MHRTPASSRTSTSDCWDGGSSNESDGWADLAPSEDAGDNFSFATEQAECQPQETVRVMLDPAGHPFCLYVH